MFVSDRRPVGWPTHWHHISLIPGHLFAVEPNVVPIGREELTSEKCFQNLDFVVFQVELNLGICVEIEAAENLALLLDFETGSQRAFGVASPEAQRRRFVRLADRLSWTDCLP